MAIDMVEIMNPSLVSAIADVITACVSFGTITLYVLHTRFLLRQTRNADEQLKLLQIQLENEKLTRMMTFHSQFQQKLREIQSDIASRSISGDIDGLDLLLEKYWNLVFDEWFICRNGGDELKGLWYEYYVPAVEFALQNPIFKKKIEEQFNSGRSFMGMHRQFKEDINELSWRAVKQGLALNHH